jgi:SAM-dependent methyltransferase
MHRPRIRLLLSVLAILVIGLAALIAIHFPYDTDAAPSEVEVKKAVEFYRQAYAASRKDDATSATTLYVKTDEGSGPAEKKEIQDFVDRYGLSGKKVLEIGAGTGQLQDIVSDYTALDISPTAERFFHKPFVLGSATALPFPDNQFDAVWSVFVLEHVPNPEQALREMRRVVKPNGYIFLQPAWYVVTWLAEGYNVRPYSDFTLEGKAIKASIPLKKSLAFRGTYIIPIRLLRLLDFWMSSSPGTLRYRRLNPNYEKYWGPDSDALNSIDPYEAYLWFASRGDECLNWSGPVPSLFRHGHIDKLVLRVRKP